MSADVFDKEERKTHKYFRLKSFVLVFYTIANLCEIIFCAVKPSIF